MNKLSRRNGNKTTEQPTTTLKLEYPEKTKKKSLKEELESFFDPAPVKEVDPENPDWDTAPKWEEEDLGSQDFLPSSERLLAEPDLGIKYRGEPVKASDLGWDKSKTSEADREYQKLTKQFSETFDKFLEPALEERSNFTSDSKTTNVQQAEELEAQLLREEEESRKGVTTFSYDREAEIIKANHTKNQNFLWTSLMDFRMNLHKVQSIANKLPQHDTYPHFAEDPDLSSKYTSAAESVRSVLHDLIELQQELVETNPHVKEAIAPQSEQRRGKKRNRETRDLEEIWDQIEPFQNSFVDYRNKIIDKWSAKTTFASGVNHTRLKALNTSLSNQIAAILANKDKVTKRSQLKRDRYRVLGKVSTDVFDESNPDAHLNDYDSEIYDDGDFLTQLLKQLLESGVTNVEGMSKAIPNLKRGAKGKTVDRGTKGKRLRYTVHQPIRSFMFPQPDRYPLYDSTLSDQLFNSLFGNNILQR
eukprot:TRINITY_DN2271_c0_g2_i1.p1 TRINITY_DN2271_c0_g2~~TRINITY_DN2271_c0_g2_i1.p1  ORF type:complete len:474 (-),score=104.20 TRINITY_DN2271_c0_g2_i1:10-1431(-)